MVVSQWCSASNRKASRKKQGASLCRWRMFYPSSRRNFVILDSRPCPAARCTVRCVSDCYNPLYAGTFAQPAPRIQRSRAPFSDRRRRMVLAPPVAAANEPLIGSVIGTEMRIGIVVARFNELVTRLLLAGALESLSRHGVAQKDIQVDPKIHQGRRGRYNIPIFCRAPAWRIQFLILSCFIPSPKPCCVAQPHFVVPAPNHRLSAGALGGVLPNPALSICSAWTEPWSTSAPLPACPRGVMV